MDNATDKLKQLLKLISTNYNRTLTEPQVELIKMMAKQYGFNQFNTAVMAHMTDPDQGMFFPNMAHIAGKVTGTKKQNDADFEVIAQSQWFNVERAISECGSYRTPSFKDAMTRAVVSSFGWANLCALTKDQLVWRQKEFVKMYVDYTNKPIEYLPSHIAGLEDIQKLKQESQTTIGNILDRIESKSNVNK
jgi:hypothetical protein